MFVIAGPCVIESRDHAIECAEAIKEEIFSKQPNDYVATPEKIDWYFKSSYDKANRTSLDSYRGPGLIKGLDILHEVKTRVGCKILTDVHLPEEVPYAAETADMIQIPAFLCRQTDLLVAAAKSGRSVNIKKGQFMTPEQMGWAINKLIMANLNDDSKSEVRVGDKTWLPGIPVHYITERGTSFGYGDLIVDFRGIPIMRKFAPVIFDATHSVQKPGGATTGGQRDMIPHLVRAAKAVGIDGLFVECHPDPDKALSDAGSQWPISRLGELLD